MKTLNLSKMVLIVSVMLFSTHAAFAQKRGGTDGGGGGAMVKYAYPGGIVSAELIDLWEARNLLKKWEKTSPYKLEIPYPSDPGGDLPVQSYLDRAMAKLRHIDPLFAERVEKDLAFVRDEHNWHRLEKEEGEEEEITLPLPRDAKLKYFSSDKVPAGMMFFDEEIDKLSIRPDIFGKLINNLNIAAAYTHEAIYKTLRDLEIVEGDSTEVRKINACLYAKDDCFGLQYAKLQPISGAKVYSCQFGRTQASLLLEPNWKPSAEWQYYKITMQMDHLGSTYYPVPLTAHFNISASLSTNGNNVSAGFPNISNQIFELYLPITSKFDSNQERSLLRQTPEGTPNVSGLLTDGDLKRLTIGDGGQIVWNGVNMTAQTFACSRVK